MKIRDPLFFAALSWVFFVADPLGHNGLFFVTALCWLIGIMALIVRWKKISRVNTTISIVLLVILALVAVPNW